MKITKIRYGRTVTKDYKAWRAEAEVELNDGDTVDEARDEAKRAVAFMLQDAMDKGAS